MNILVYYLSNLKRVQESKAFEIIGEVKLTEVHFKSCQCAGLAASRFRRCCNIFASLTYTKCPQEEGGSILEYPCQSLGRAFIRMCPYEA